MQDDLETFVLDGYVVVYSLTDKTSFETAIDILDGLRQEVGPEKAIILVANKSDLVRKRRVSAEGMFISYLYFLTSRLISVCNPELYFEKKTAF